MQRELLQQQMRAERSQLDRVREKLKGLAVLSPAEGQLGGLNATIGQQVAQGEAVGELSVLSSFKVTARLNEYYMERVTTGLKASVEQRALRSPVTLGRQNPQQYEVLEGLQEGDRVIVSGYDALARLR